MSEPLRIQIEGYTLRDWRVRLHKIAEPSARYNEDMVAMQKEVIKQSTETAKSLIEEIEQIMGPHL